MGLTMGRTFRAIPTSSLSLAIAVVAILAGAVVSGAGRKPAGYVVRPRLTAISSLVNPTGVSVVIEASEPAPYVLTRPEPLTIYVEFRDVGALGLGNRCTPHAGSPIAAVSVESSRVATSPASRVKITLAQAVAHRVHSDRNTVVVDLDRPSDEFG